MSSIVPTLAAALLVAACTPRDAVAPHRCLEVITPAALEVPGLPPQPGPVFGSSSVGRGRSAFELEAEAILQLDDLATAVASLCGQLEAQITASCSIRPTSTAPDHCAFAVASPQAPAAGDQHRRMHGHLILLGDPTDDGRTRLLVLAAEWSG